MMGQCSGNGCGCTEHSALNIPHFTHIANSMGSYVINVLCEYLLTRTVCLTVKVRVYTHNRSYRLCVCSNRGNATHLCGQASSSGYVTLGACTCSIGGQVDTMMLCLHVHLMYTVSGQQTPQTTTPGQSPLGQQPPKDIYPLDNYDNIFV